MKMKHIGNLIASIRKDKNISQEQLAAKVGVSRVQMGKYERGETKLTVDIISSICDALEISINSLLEKDKNILNQAKTTNMEKPDELINQLWSRISELEKENESKDEIIERLLDRIQGKKPGRTGTGS